MEDEHPYLFILIFRDHSSLETWRAHVQSLVTVYQQQRCERALEEFGGECESCVYPPGFCASQKAMRMLGRSTVASATHKRGMLEDNDVLSRYSFPTPLIAPHMSAGPSDLPAPLPHLSPMDLILVTPIPSVLCQLRPRSS